jgi:non-canonical (house-cleaning) NTP pyrophosphatase
MKHLLEGKDLNEAMEAETGIKEAGKDVGFNGWISKNTITRKDANIQAVLLAIAGLEHCDG